MNKDSKGAASARRRASACRELQRVDAIATATAAALPLELHLSHGLLFPLPSFDSVAASSSSTNPQRASFEGSVPHAEPE